MKITNIIVLTIINSYLISVIFCVGSLSSLKMNTHFGLYKKLQPGESAEIPQDKSMYAPKNLTADDLPDIPIYYQGWIKYFNFHKTNDKKTSKPKFFFKNEAFLKQISENSTDKEDDQVIIYFYYFYNSLEAFKYQVNQTFLLLFMRINLIFSVLGKRPF